MAAWLSSKAFSTMISSLTSPQSVSLQSTAALTLGLLHNPWTPAPSHCTFQGTCVPAWSMYGWGKDCLILIPFWLPQSSCFTLSLKSFPSDSGNCPNVGIGTLLQFPHPPRAGPVLLTCLFPPLVPSSSQVCMVLYILFLWSGTPVRSQLVFCMHFCVWRCIPDASVETDVLHIHLLLRHLFSPRWLMKVFYSCALYVCDSSTLSFSLSPCHDWLSSGSNYSLVSDLGLKRCLGAVNYLLWGVRGGGGRLMRETSVSFSFCLSFLTSRSPQNLNTFFISCWRVNSCL